MKRQVMVELILGLMAISIAVSGVLEVMQK